MPPSIHTESAAVNSGGNHLTSDFVWGAAAIGEVIGRSPRQTYNLLVNNRIRSAKRVGKMWVASRRALLAEFGAQ